MLFFIAFIILFTVNGVYSLNCDTVQQGEHYPSFFPFHGFKRDLIISTRVQFNQSTAHYLFPPTESRGRLCSESWNELWDSTRCGYLTDNHMDSDRFGWRRAGSCLIYDSAGHVIGERTNCSEANLIELAAAAYDGGLKPFDHPGTLLKQFSVKSRIDTWYHLRLVFQETATLYQLFDNSKQILDTQIINHRSCFEFQHGMLQSLYFGGECPAPQVVTVCYDE